MNHTDEDDYLRVTVGFLLIFIIVVGVAVWLVDPISQQRGFGFLMGAEFIAFAMLVYLFYMEDPAAARKLLTAGFVALTVLILLAAAVLAGVGAAPQLKPSVSVTLYAGEVSMTQYGFGNSPTSISSPGPTLTFTVGDIVNMTVFNAGSMPHSWALTSSNSTSAKVLFGAKIDSGTVPIPVGESGSVLFKVSKAGNYHYICQVPGHVQLGMWGNVVVNP